MEPGKKGILLKSREPPIRTETRIVRKYEIAVKDKKIICPLRKVCFTGSAWFRHIECEWSENVNVR